MLPATFVPGFSDEDQVKKMVYQPLGKTGISLSKLSLGGSVYGGAMIYGDYEEAEACETVKRCISSGINYVDTAPHYGLGKSEIFLGKILKQVPRNSYYLSTKVCRFGAKFDFTRKGVLDSFEQSLKRLQTDYVDIVVVHDVEFADSLDVVLEEALPAVEELVKNKKAKFICVSGYPVSVLYDVICKSTVRIDCVLSYCRDILTDDELQKFIPKFQEKRVGVINAGCLGLGLLTNRGPPLWHPASENLKELCSLASKYCEQNEVELGRLALYYSLNQPGSCSHLVGMNDKKTLQTNLDVFHNGITEKELKILENVREKFFKPEHKHNWEGVEIERYKNNVLGAGNLK